MEGDTQEGAEEGSEMRDICSKQDQLQGLSLFLLRLWDYYELFFGTIMKREGKRQHCRVLCFENNEVAPPSRHAVRLHCGTVLNTGAAVIE